jgi:hypothetical protein
MYVSEVTDENGLVTKSKNYRRGGVNLNESKRNHNPSQFEMPIKKRKGHSTSVDV